MSKKSNVHPDHYKTAGRDRPDDAARARLNRAIAAKASSQQRPDRMSKGFYFERPEPAQPEAPEAPAAPAAKRTPARKGPAKKTGARKAPAARTTPRKTASGKRAAKPVAKKR
jgi:hypothetical protein